MKKLLFSFFLFSVLLYAQELSYAMQSNLKHKGKKIATLLCDKEKLLATNKEAADIEQQIATSCPKLDSFEMQCLKLYLQDFKKEQETPTLSIAKMVPKHAKCPTCGMLVHLYPEWAATLKTGSKQYYFDGVKDMLKYYFQKFEHLVDEKQKPKMLVQDFYRFNALDATKAWYVVGSDIHGPMGNEFIPFATKKDATTFLHDHHAQKILRFNSISLETIEMVERLP